MTLLVRVNGEEHEVVVAAEEWPRNQWDKNDAPRPVQRPKINVPPDQGLSLSLLPPDDKAKLAASVGMGGVLVTNVVANSDAASRGMANGDIMRVQDKPVTTPEEVKQGVDAVRAEKHGFVLMLVLPKKSTVAGPKWVALQLDPERG